MKTKAGIPDQFDDLLVYDPGGTTGYARIKVERARNEIHLYEVGEFHLHSRMKEHISKLDNQRSVLLYESIVINTRFPTPQEVRLPIEIIGITKFLCCEYGVLHFEQAPAVRNAAESWYPKLREIYSHLGSATRHGVVFACEKLMPRSDKFPELIYDKKLLMANARMG
jgi:hypothetical protein